MEVPRLKVLIVDDDPAVVRLISTIVSAVGHDVSTAQDGDEALNAIRADCPDMVISDWDMPQMDGIELIKSMKEDSAYKGIPIIMLTTESDEEERERGLKTGASSYLTKPVSREVLMEEVGKYL